MKYVPYSVVTRFVGTSTIFLESIRISTNVMDQSGKRALGTSAAEDVSRHVLVEGKRWTDRAQVLSDWYITAYEPITDIFERRVGMLYVGALEAKYLDVRKRAIIVFALITVGGVLSAFVLGWFLTGIIMRPLNRLIRASVEISKGNFSPDIKPISKSDMGILQREFLNMINALIEREKRQKEESEICLIQSEKQASVGKLAAGVAHEINNPLTAVLTFAHLILRREDLPEEVRADLETITTQTERVRKIVKSLLDFSRQSQLNPEPLDLNRQIARSIKLLGNQALIKGVDLNFNAESGLPMFTLDRNLCQSVWINMIINALDDPFMTPDVIPHRDKLSEHVTLELSEAGGHVGFIEGGTPWRPKYYLPPRIIQFLSGYSASTSFMDNRTRP